MAKIEIVTKEDLKEFKEELLQEFKIVVGDVSQNLQWLRSHEVADKLGICMGTLKNLRDSRQIPFTKVGGILLYSMNDINNMLLANMIHIED
jgi:phenylacetate-coenzyme A ligase PaaK-like adenylate-forming protein|tara:strand:+ start:922 stop:1197 length:276 start_codon:yes stop_codon:yes gene_type:complete